MTQLPILKWPDAALSTKCEPVAPDVNLREFIADMFDTMYGAPGRGLAAPQVGVLKRVFVIDTSWKEGTPSPKVFVNPAVISHSQDLCIAEEGCLSIPGLLTKVERPARIRVQWLDETGQPNEDTFDGIEARCIQHEYDHLEGRVTFDHLSCEMRLQAEAEYRTTQGEH